VSSVEPVSATIISSAKSLAQFNPRSIVAPSFLTVTAREKVIIGPPDNGMGPMNRGVLFPMRSSWAIRRRQTHISLGGRPSDPI
jgi:hypothetical protein